MKLKLLLEFHESKVGRQYNIVVLTASYRLACSSTKPTSFTCFKYSNKTNVAVCINFKNYNFPYLNYKCNKFLMLFGNGRFLMLLKPVENVLCFLKPQKKNILIY